MISITPVEYDEQADTFKIVVHNDNLIQQEVIEDTIGAGILAALLNVFDEPTYFLGRTFNLTVTTS